MRRDWRFWLVVFASFLPPLGAQCVDRRDPNIGVGLFFRNAQGLNSAGTVGFSGLVVNVQDCGAKGDGSTDDTKAIQAAISFVFANSQTPTAPTSGGIVFFPAGKYVITGTIQVPVSPNSGNVILRGSGMRVTYLVATGPSTNFTGTGTSAVPTVLLFGSATPDPAGTFTQVTQYVGMEDLSLSGTSITSGSVRALMLTECQFCWVRNSIIELFPNSSTGIYLRGSTITGGLGTSNSAPHTRLSRFENVIVATIGTAGVGAASIPHALEIQNADENDFYNCDFSLTTGLTAPTDSVVDVAIEIGRNNRFFGVLYAGDVVNKNQIALKFGRPKNEAGVANGSVLQNQDYGMVAEGWDITVMYGGDNSGNTVGNMVLGAFPSIMNTPFVDSISGQSGPGNFQNGSQGASYYNSPVAGINYAAIASPSSPTGLLKNGQSTDTIGGSDTWSTANAGATTLTNLVMPAGATFDGHTITLRCNDANTTLGDVLSHGGGNIRLMGRQDLKCLTGYTIRLTGVAGVWYQTSLMVPVTNTTGLPIAQALWDRQTALTCGAGTTPGIDASQASYYTCNITANVAVVVAVPVNPPAAGQSTDITIALRNSSGGALTTAPTFNAGAGGFKFAGGSIVNPGNGTQVLYKWRWDPVQSFFYLVAVSTAL